MCMVYTWFFQIFLNFISSCVRYMHDNAMHGICYRMKWAKRTGPAAWTRAGYVPWRWFPLRACQTPVQPPLCSGINEWATAHPVSATPTGSRYAHPLACRIICDIPVPMPGLPTGVHPLPSLMYVCLVSPDDFVKPVVPISSIFIISLS
jgi:hypothetical protein